MAFTSPTGKAAGTTTRRLIEAMRAGGPVCLAVFRV
jgi:hypothetical protein